MEMETKQLVYLLIDTSSSMVGEPIEAVKQAIKAMVAEWKEQQMDCLLGVIAYHTVAREVVLPTALAQFQLPRLRMGGVSDLEKACDILEQCLQGKQVQKPLIFLYTDGKQTRVSLPKIKTLQQKTTWIGCCAGATGERKPLEEITEQVVWLNTLTYGEFSQFLR